MAGKKAFLKKENVQKLIESLRSRYEVFYPVAKPGTKWHTFSTHGTADLDYKLTINPPKKVFFPPFETMFGISGGNLVEEKPQTSETTWARWNGPSQNSGEKPILLFGVHIHDVAALLILDKVFVGGEKFRDPYYLKRRKGSVIVALKNGEGPDAFQADYEIDWVALGSRAERSHGAIGWDVLLEEADGGYLATAGTKCGEKIISDAKFFPEAASGIKPTPWTGKKTARLDLKKIAEAITPEKTIWNDIAARCFGCGNCSYTCPICHCFEVEDRLEVTGAGKRERRWDSCYLSDFARVSGGRADAGHNFRPNLANRTFYWYHHKFVRAPLERGTVDCIGCGRCITFCPAKIQIRDELGKLQTNKGGK